MSASIKMRPAERSDEPRLQELREAAFAPVFASFRSLLGEEIYELAQAREDAAHGELLRSLLVEGSDWELYVAELESAIVGFVAVRLDHATLVGEIGLNAVHPEYAGRGAGTKMYEFALARMREAGMRVATVGTGADASHAPARRAYRKAGFTAEVPSVWMCRKL